MHGPRITAAFCALALALAARCAGEEASAPGADDQAAILSDQGRLASASAAIDPGLFLPASPRQAAEHHLSLLTLTCRFLTRVDQAVIPGFQPLPFLLGGPSPEVMRELAQRGVPYAPGADIHQLNDPAAISLLERWQESNERNRCTNQLQERLARISRELTPALRALAAPLLDQPGESACTARQLLTRCGMAVD